MPQFPVCCRHLKPDDDDGDGDGWTGEYYTPPLSAHFSIWSAYNLHRGTLNHIEVCHNLAPVNCGVSRVSVATVISISIIML